MDPTAFHALALAEVDAVHRLAHHLTHDPADADDLVQEVYLKAMRAADTFTPAIHGIRPWLFKILHNCLHTRRAKDRRRRDHLRHLQKSARPMEQIVSPSVYSLADANGHSTAAVDWDATDERLCRAVAALPVAHRTVFLLSAVEDLKYREIADVVGVPVGTVMSRLSRARVALAAQLSDLAGEHNLRRRVPAGPKSAEGGDA